MKILRVLLHIGIITAALTVANKASAGWEIKKSKKRATAYISSLNDTFGYSKDLFAINLSCKTGKMNVMIAHPQKLKWSKKEDITIVADGKLTSGTVSAYQDEFFFLPPIGVINLFGKSKLFVLKYKRYISPKSNQFSPVTASFLTEGIFTAIAKLQIHCKGQK